MYTTYELYSKFPVHLLDSINYKVRIIIHERKTNLDSVNITFSKWLTSYYLNHFRRQLCNSKQFVSQKKQEQDGSNKLKKQI